jgi:hypothetical protein
LAGAGWANTGLAAIVDAKAVIIVKATRFIVVVI